MSIPVYILKRILVSIPTILLVSMIGFFLMRFDFTIGPVDLPLGQGESIRVIEQTRIWNQIDPLAPLRHNPQISPAALEHERQRLGLDKPFVEQYWLWLTHVLQFHPSAPLEGNFLGFFTPDLGKTFTGNDVSALLMERAGNTLLLNVICVALSWLIAIPLGIYAALHWRTASDRLLTVFSAIGMAMPGFVLALVLAVVVVKTGILPFGGLKSDNFAELSLWGKVWDMAKHLALPVIVLTTGGIAGLQRQMRGNLLDVLGAEYIRTARAKGLPEGKVIYKHAVRTAINPLVTMFGYEFSALLGGAILVETVLGYPGLGRLIYQAVLETDTNLVMASLVMSAVMLVLGNLLADILLKVVDPRIELE
jgi:peptide/nickel transport system permease protein